MRVLVAGEDAAAVETLRAGLVAAGAQADACPADAAAVLEAFAAGDSPPVAVVVLGGAQTALSRSLDPFGLENGPPVVPASDIVDDGSAFGPAGVRRLRTLVRLRVLHGRNRELEAVIAAHAVSRRRELQAAQLDGLRRIAQAAEYRDDNSHEHTERVGHLAAQLAGQLGLGDRTVWVVRRTAPLHDIGKIAIPDSILLKPGRLSEEEFEVVKGHALLGARVLAGGDTELLEVAERIARSHHERWDGGGYPDALAGEDIPAVGRVVHVADVFDVLVHERPYKDSWTVEAAVEEIRSGAGTQFDPEVVRAFEELGPSVWRADPASF